MKRLFTIFTFMLVPTFAYAFDLEISTEIFVIVILGVPTAMLALLKICDHFSESVTDLLDSATGEERANFEKFKKGAKKRDAVSQCRFGDIYKDGKGVVKDFTKAEKWFRKSAKNGNLEAQNELGKIYENYDSRHSKTALMKPEKVEALYLESASGGNFHAMYNLGRIHEKGIIVEKDIKEAYKWYKESAEYNYRPAIKRRDALAGKI